MSALHFSQVSMDKQNAVLWMDIDVHDWQSSISLLIKGVGTTRKVLKGSRSS